jgi:Zn-dependent peptidase ImmA (M78 family)
MSLDIRKIASRLTATRGALSYSTLEVSSCTGIDQDRLIQIESGNTTPLGDEILILANFYNCDFRSFLDESIPAPAQNTEILFRRYGDSLSAVDKRNIQKFLNLCQIEEQLEKSFNLQKKIFEFSPRGNFYKGHGESAANAMRELLDYSENEVGRDVYEDFRSIGIHVFRMKLDDDNISGLYIKDLIAGHCVLVNYREDVYRQRFSVAHEVAHAIFDSSESAMLSYEPVSNKYDKNDLREIRANSFASHYLMPISMLRRLTNLDSQSALYWAQEFRVSTAALSKALKDANLIDNILASSIRAVRVSSDQKIDPEAPHTLTSAQKSRRLLLLERGLSAHYVNLCFKSYEEGLSSFGRLAEMLLVSSDDLAEIAYLFGRRV